MLDITSKTDAENPAGQPVPTYAALLERRLIVPPASTQYFAVDRSFFFTYFAHILSHIHFDDQWYLAKYPDVPVAIANGIIASARHHYMRHGFFEHRLPYKIEVDEAWYRQKYADVNTAMEKQQFTSAQAHFEVYGFREGRLPHPGFQLRRAVASDPVGSPQKPGLPAPTSVVAARQSASVLRVSSPGGRDPAMNLRLSIGSGRNPVFGTAIRRLAWAACIAALLIPGFRLNPDLAPGDGRPELTVTAISAADDGAKPASALNAPAPNENTETESGPQQAGQDLHPSATASTVAAPTEDVTQTTDGVAGDMSTTVRPAFVIRLAALSQPPIVEPRPPVVPAVGSAENAGDALPAVPPPEPEPAQAVESPAAAPSEPLKALEPLSPSQLTQLLQSGAEMLAAGNIWAARLLYERAAAAGSGQAALEVATTYDPRFLVSKGAMGVTGNPVIATVWYRRALALGEAKAANVPRP